MDHQLLREASQLEKYTSELEQHEAYLSQQISELMQFMEQLDALKKNSEKSMLVSVGKRVYLKTEVTDKKFFVDVGAGVVVRKTPEELEAVIAGQLKKLRESQAALAQQLAFYGEKLHDLMHMLEQQHVAAQS